MLFSKVAIEISEFPFRCALVEKNKIVERNDRYKDIVGDSLPSSEQIQYGEEVYLVQELNLAHSKRLIYLIPITDLVQLDVRFSQLEREHKQLQKTLNSLLEGLPIGILIVDPESKRILFANNTFLNISEISLEIFYSQPYLFNLIKADKLEALIKEAERGNVVLPAEEIQVTTLNGKEKWWLIYAQKWESPRIKGVLCAIVDHTKQKEQELALQEAYQELEAQNEMLLQQQEELQVLNEQLNELNQTLEKQKKDLEEGLKYARKVQLHLLSPEKLPTEWERFRIKYWTRAHTYVSGDFLWYRKTDSYLFLGICDATGHGAGGALMATLGYFLLDKVWEICEGNPERLGEMMTILHKEMIRVLGSKKEKISTEGMEGLVLALPLNNDASFVYYAGAKRPLVVVKGTEVEEFLTDKISVGFVLNGKEEHRFSTYRLPLDSDLRLYGFSDGITDQFGYLSGRTKRFGRKKLRRLIQETASYPFNKQWNSILSILEKWQGDLEDTDDKILVGISFERVK